jgi:hydroxyacylglutathione hydrolase
VLAGQPDPPRYFAQMKQINRAGPRLLGGIRRPARLPVASLVEALEQGAPVVDTRQAADFAHGAVPGTINIAANRSFTSWAGWMLPYERDFYLIVDDRRSQTIDDVVRDLAGIGLDRIAGYFGSEVVDAWRASKGSLQTIPSLSTSEVAREIASNDKVVLDVRGEGEWKAGHLPGSVNLPVGDLEQRLNELPRGHPLIVHCQSGSRASIAASVLRARGFTDVRLFPGGFAEWRSAGHPVEGGS